jgi:hypothetical protein
VKFRDAVKPVAEQYLKIVGRQTDLPVNLEIDQFFSWLYKAYSEKAGPGKDNVASMQLPKIRVEARELIVAQAMAGGEPAEEMTARVED